MTQHFFEQSLICQHFLIQAKVSYIAYVETCCTNTLLRSAVSVYTCTVFVSLVAHTLLCPVILLNTCTVEPGTSLSSADLNDFDQLEHNKYNQTGPNRPITALTFKRPPRP